MYEDKLCAMVMCPVTGLEMNGEFHFLLDFTSDKDDAPGTSYDKQEINPEMIEPAKFAKHHIPKEDELGDTHNPDITFPSQRSCDVVRPMALPPHTESEALKNFKVLMALNNLASQKERMRKRILKDANVIQYT